MFAITQKHLEILVTMPDSDQSEKYGVTYNHLADYELCCDLEGLQLVQLHPRGGVNYASADDEILGVEIGRRDTWTRTFKGDTIVQGLITRMQEMVG